MLNVSSEKQPSHSKQNLFLMNGRNLFLREELEENPEDDCFKRLHMFSRNPFRKSPFSHQLIKNEMNMVNEGMNERTNKQTNE